MPNENDRTLGGLGPESTPDYCRRIIRAFQERKSVDCPEIVIYSANLTEGLKRMEGKHWVELHEIIGAMEFWVAAAVALLAGFMRGFVGVGSGMLMAPVFAILFGPLQTVGMVILLDAFVTAQLMPSVRRLIEWRVIIPMAGVAALFMPVGTWLLVNIDARFMTRAIAFIVMAFVLLLMTGWRYRGPKRLGITLGVGGLSGILIAATSMGNPPVIVYFLSGPDPAAVNRANFTGYFAVTLATLLVMMTARGLIEGATVARTALLLPVFTGGAWLGARYFYRSTDRRYRQVALGLLLGVAVYGLLR